VLARFNHAGALNTFTFPERQYLSLSGTVTGFFTPTNGR